MSAHPRVRKKAYYQINTHLAGLDNSRLLGLLEGPGKVGWTTCQIVKVGGKKVFVKRMPVTDKEVDCMYSTKNLYRLPMYYQYGVGSAGFGAFRELLAHVKTTNWVLQGEIENFPLMYYHRIVPRRRRPKVPKPEQIQGYVAYWNGSKRIERYMLERYRARHEAVIFLEYIPYTMTAWVESHIDRLPWLIAELQGIIGFLRKKHMVHFDAHSDNVLTDGKRVYLTDFGLLLDKSFDLDTREMAFLREHRHYDEGELFSNLSSHIILEHLSSAESRQLRLLRAYDLEGRSFHDIALCLIDNIEEISERGYLKLEPSYIEMVIRYRPIILMMIEFYSELRANPRKNTKLDHGKLARLLRAAKSRGS